jgi:hypothetical protein
MADFDIFGRAVRDHGRDEFGAAGAIKSSPSRRLAGLSLFRAPALRYCARRSYRLFARWQEIFRFSNHVAIRKRIQDE